jgi:hypothetical protein
MSVYETPLPSATEAPYVEALLATPHDGNKDFETYPVAEAYLDAPDQRVSYMDGYGEWQLHARHGGLMVPADVRTFDTPKGDLVLNLQAVAVATTGCLDALGDYLSIDPERCHQGMVAQLKRHRDAGRQLPPDQENILDQLADQPERARRLLLAQGLGMNAVVTSLPGETHLDNGTVIGHADDNTRKFSDGKLYVTRDNPSCKYPALKLSALYGSEISVPFFMLASEVPGRGQVAQIIKSGDMRVGEPVRISAHGRR